MKTKTIFIILISTTLFTTACSLQKDTKNNVDIANPASIYCEDNWWTLELISGSGGDYGVCNFPDWSSCEEREFFRWECSPELKQKVWIENAGTVCTMEVKECADWSYVGRSWPGCAFAPCPNEETTNTNQNKTELESISGIQELIEDHKNTIDKNNTWIKEEAITLMEEIINQLK